MQRQNQPYLAIRNKTFASDEDLQNAHHMAGLSRAGNSARFREISRRYPGFRLHKRRHKNSGLARRMTCARWRNYSDRSASADGMRFYTELDADFSARLAWNQESSESSYRIWLTISREKIKVSFRVPLCSICKLKIHWYIWTFRKVRVKFTNQKWMSLMLLKFPMWPEVNNFPGCPAGLRQSKETSRKTRIPS